MMPPSLWEAVLGERDAVQRPLPADFRKAHKLAKVGVPYLRVESVRDRLHDGFALIERHEARVGYVLVHTHDPLADAFGAEIIRDARVEPGRAYLVAARDDYSGGILAHQLAVLEVR